MKNLASELKNAPHGELRFGVKMGKLKAMMHRSSADMNIKRMSENSILLDIPNVCEKILKIHNHFRVNGKISD